jgi:hypothetical protein
LSKYKKLKATIRYRYLLDLLVIHKRCGKTQILIAYVDCFVDGDLPFDFNGLIIFFVINSIGFITFDSPIVTIYEIQNIFFLNLWKNTIIMIILE